MNSTMSLPLLPGDLFQTIHDCLGELYTDKNERWGSWIPRGVRGLVVTDIKRARFMDPEDSEEIMVLINEQLWWIAVSDVEHIK